MSTRSPAASLPCSNNACQALSAASGTAAASVWLSARGSGASSSVGIAA
jgi:hypothetical protein